MAGFGFDVEAIKTAGNQEDMYVVRQVILSII